MKTTLVLVAALLAAGCAGKEEATFERLQPPTFVACAPGEVGQIVIDTPVTANVRVAYDGLMRLTGSGTGSVEVAFFGDFDDRHDLNLGNGRSVYAASIDWTTYDFVTGPAPAGVEHARITFTASCADAPTVVEFAATHFEATP